MDLDVRAYDDTSGLTIAATFNSGRYHADGVRRMLASMRAVLARMSEITLRVSRIVAEVPIDEHDPAL
jgi:hypothetical protein